MAFKENLRETAKILGVNVGTEDIDTDDLLAEINTVLSNIMCKPKLIATLEKPSNLTSSAAYCNYKINDDIYFEQGKQYVFRIAAADAGRPEAGILPYIRFSNGIQQSINYTICIAPGSGTGLCNVCIDKNNKLESATIKTDKDEYAISNNIDHIGNFEIYEI